ncbi:MAG: hypothetical protein SNF33_03910 [Candidatus Algichlamydia australiensis]|nr:hypothetical protein [Chlamydiales bacterium]
MIFLLFLAASVILKNDSPYTLNAELFDKDLKPVSKMTLPPNSYFKWNETYQNLTSYSEGPFAVLWTCLSGAEYGVNYKVAASTTCNAQSASGARRCQPTKEESGP